MSESEKFAKTVSTGKTVRRLIFVVLIVVCLGVFVGPIARMAWGAGTGSMEEKEAVWRAYWIIAVFGGLLPFIPLFWKVKKAKSWLSARPLFANIVVIGAGLIAATHAGMVAAVLEAGVGYGWTMHSESGSLTTAAKALVAFDLYLLWCITVQQLGALFVGLKSPIYLWVVSYPATLGYSTALFGCMPLAIVHAVASGPEPAAVVAVAAFGLAAFGLAQSLLDSPWEEVTVTVESPAGFDADAGGSREPRDGVYAARGRHSGKTRLGPLELSRGRGGDEPGRPLRIVQITDPHIGPFISIRRMNAFCEQTVALDPDLVLMTGDYCTTEAHLTPGCLAAAFAPLAALKGRVYATLGNHDHEVLRFVKDELAALGVILIVDAEALVETQAGLVQLVGVDFFFHDKPRLYSKVIRRFPPNARAAYRILLIHDPGAFRYVPADDHALVLSGHTHGGQIGLVSCGLEKCTAVSVGSIGRIPDHGVWQLGTNRLYVNRGQGTRFMGGNFLVRFGVPAEASVLVVTTDSTGVDAPEVSDSVFTRHEREEGMVGQ
ncbi:Ser/Thr protein phosphatase [Thecamonas trahens ATCC 50062]|uniref:Ser/Thr protein phosphatase n=1 Tax=Thecamonas trahens ATCC 50062 TaxID=461836 RepID=A0A0L0DG40_THETB|nr:Ser/Thr protein phosphatase [Thecamonas trahens ATCC 50062]KNC50313.1 Ser/Thr protein phosphatase [Thecamonas trahens ATCC 50062]|eukprot:XP_013756860.1 Ser/Thr protein phosphatase [Thecamonas trahens ATCC 50062]